MRTPPTFAEPAETVSTSVPRLDTRCSIDAFAPSPSAIMTITAATPMMTPSEVNAERSLLRVIASKASAIVLLNFMIPYGPGGRRLLRYRDAAASAARAASRSLAGAAAAVASDRAMPVMIDAPSVSRSVVIATCVPSDTPMRTGIRVSRPSTSCHTAARRADVRPRPRRGSGGRELLRAPARSA